MLIYRYEKEDGGGPWFRLSGVARRKVSPDNLYYMNDGKLSGCTSIESLNAYFKDQGISLDECHVVIYNIPDEYVQYLRSHVVFPKRFRNKKTRIKDV